MTMLLLVAAALVLALDGLWLTRRLRRLARMERDARRLAE